MNETSFRLYFARGRNDPLMDSPFHEHLMAIRSLPFFFSLPPALLCRRAEEMEYFWRLIEFSRAGIIPEGINTAFNSSASFLKR